MFRIRRKPKAFHQSQAENCEHLTGRRNAIGITGWRSSWWGMSGSLEDCIFEGGNRRQVNVGEGVEGALGGVEEAENHPYVIYKRRINVTKTKKSPK